MRLLEKVLRLAGIVQRDLFVVLLVAGGNLCVKARGQVYAE